MVAADDFQKQVGVRLRQAREEAHLTQAQVATALGVAEGTYNRYESAERAISVTLLRAAARTLGKPVSYFFGEDARVSDDELAAYQLRNLDPDTLEEAVRYVRYLRERDLDKRT